MFFEAVALDGQVDDLMICFPLERLKASANWVDWGRWGKTATRRLVRYVRLRAVFSLWKLTAPRHGRALSIEDSDLWGVEVLNSVDTLW